MISPKARITQPFSPTTLVFHNGNFGCRTNWYYFSSLVVDPPDKSVTFVSSGAKPSTEA
jgi:hypothetical protein